MPDSTNTPNPGGAGSHEGGDRPRGDRPYGGGRGGDRPYGGGRGGDRGDRPYGGGRGGDRMEGRGDERGGRRPRRFHRGKVCQFCVDKAIYIDYKDLEKLRNYVSDSGKILPRRITGACASHQRMVTVALKRARMMALLPYKSR